MTAASWPWSATASTTPRPWRGPTSGWRFAGVGGDLAAEAGSVVLLGDPLAALPETIRLARQTVRVIRQNILFFAFGLNAVAVVLAGLRVLGPVAAAIVHQIGSLLVLLNAIRLLGFERWHTLWIRPRRRAGRFGLPALPAVGGARPRSGGAGDGSFAPPSWWRRWLISARGSR